MIKFTGADQRGQVIGLGLSADNCRRLIAGEPIEVAVRELGIDSDLRIVLFGGQTETAMFDRLCDLGWKPDAKLHIRPERNG